MNPDSKLLPSNIVKHMSPKDRKALNVHTPEEISAKQEAKLEKELHEQFLAWTCHQPVYVIHSRMDRKSTNAVGTPDFFVMRGAIMKPDFDQVRCVVAVEFKIKGNKPSDDQEREIAKLRAVNIPVLVAYSFEEAVEFTKRELYL